MREIEFRGKTARAEWEYGYHAKFRNYKNKVYSAIIPKDEETGEAYMEDLHSVIPVTVGQFTGLTDKNGKKIFEGDIVTGRFLHSLPINSVIAFRNGAFGLLWDRAGAETFDAFTSLCNIEYEVIGNIHDNPELVEVKHAECDY